MVVSQFIPNNDKLLGADTSYEFYHVQGKKSQ